MFLFYFEINILLIYDADEIVFVSETKLSKEEKELAESLMLPPNYFAYKYSDKDCPGCVGCDQENNEV